MKLLPGDLLADLEQIDRDDLGVVEEVRERLLTADELALLLQALPDAPLEPLTRIGLQLILLTGLRTQEVRTLRWADVDTEAKVLRIRVENQKLTLKAARKAKPYAQPLSPVALALLENAKTFSGKSEWVFPSVGKKSPCYTEKAFRRALSRTVEENAKLSKLETFAPHDFRTALATWASPLFGPILADQLLGHSLKSTMRSSVAHRYNLDDFVEPKRKALDAWAEHLERLASGKTAKLVALAR
jgi:integrase